MGFNPVVEVHFHPNQNLLVGLPEVDYNPSQPVDCQI